MIQKMNNTVKYRGPDDEGIFLDEKISLGHRRLAILDLSEAGHQPMLSQDGSLVIVFNGEIYNFPDLKKKLAGFYNFRTQSDTEVILAAYQKWGYDCVKKLNGIFALAIWDKNKQELFLARDHLGVKPLYYYHDGDKLVFSSEIKGILAVPVQKEINGDALNLYFRLMYIPEPFTPWKKIAKLPPAHYLVWKNGTLQKTAYWRIEKFDSSHDHEEIKERIKNSFETAVQRQLLSDRPVGLYLSGGLDSTALLGIMSKNSKQAVKTFSVGFEVSEQEEKFNADFRLAEKTSHYYRTEHQNTILSPKDVVNNFENIIWHADDLVANHTQPAMYVLSALARKKVAVVLAGDGGDELFAGYERYYLSRLVDRMQIIPKFLRDNFLVRNIFQVVGAEDSYAKINSSLGIERWLTFMSQKERDVARILRPDFNNPEVTRNFLLEKFSYKKNSISKPPDSAKGLQYLDIQTWLVDDALNRADRMSMAHGVEERVPFLDKDLVELAMAIPSRYTLKNRQSGKEIFKEALREVIPEHVYNQPKRGWFSPMSKWIRGELRNWAYEILSPKHNPDTANLLNYPALKNILDRHVQRKEYALNTIWSAIVFQYWYKLFVNK